MPSHPITYARETKKNKFFYYCTNAAFIVVLLIEGKPVEKKFFAGHCPDMKP